MLRDPYRCFRAWTMLNKQKALGSSHAMFNTMPAKSVLGLLMSDRLWKAHWAWNQPAATEPEALSPATSCLTPLVLCNTATGQHRWPLNQQNMLSVRTPFILSNVF